MLRIAGALALVVVSAAVAAAEPVRLAPHRAVYELSLGKASRVIESARGRIVFDFGGDACTGYTQLYRQVTVLESGETGSRTSDLRNASHEGGDGASFRFKTESTVNGASKPATDGEASREGGRVAVRLKSPKPDTLPLAPEAIFPTEHLKRVIEAARRGATTLEAKVYDGSDDGSKVYDSLAVIGRRIAPGSTDALEEPARDATLAQSPRWPTTISYFSPGEGERTPVYTIAFDLYENGVSRALRLDYGEFSLNGRLESLEMRAASDCAR